MFIKHKHNPKAPFIGTSFMFSIQRKTHALSTSSENKGMLQTTLIREKSKKNYYASHLQCTNITNYEIICKVSYQINTHTSNYFK